MKKAFFVIGLAAAVGLTVACGDDDASPGTPGPTSSSSSSSSSSGAPSPCAGCQLSGLLGGKSFIAASAYFFKNDTDGLDLFFSDKAGACQDSIDGKLQADETALQFYNVGVGPNDVLDRKAAVGDNTTEDAKYVHVAASCASGGAVTSDHSGFTSKSATVSLTTLTATAVDGSFSLSFNDGSTINGTFHADACTSTTKESQTCR